MAMTARDVMQPHVLSVSPSSPLTNVQRMFFDEEIHGAPVVDETGSVVGMLTSTDLVRCGAELRDGSERRPATFDYLADLFEFSPDGPLPGSDYAPSGFGDLTVADAMTEGVISVTPDASVQDVARAMQRDRVHRVLVVEEGRLCGIVSTTDLVALLAGDN